MKMLIINTNKEQNDYGKLLTYSPLLPPTDKSFQSDGLSLGKMVEGCYRLKHVKT